MASALQLSLACSVLICFLVAESLGCNGYNLKVNSIKSCASGNIMKVDDNFDVTLDRGCNLIPKGCATITKPFKTFSVKYSLNKPPMPEMTGEIDVCEYVKERKMAAELLSTFAFPNKCPVKAQKLCVTGDKKYNIGKYKTQLGFIAGNIKVKLEGQHDTGNSCTEIDVTIKK